MKIGYWTDMKRPDSFIKKWKKRKIFLKQLKKIEEIIYEGKRGRIFSYKGSSHCRICKICNGSKEFKLGKYTWPEGYIHYIEEHKVKPPQDFIDFINRFIL